MKTPAMLPALSLMFCLAAAPAFSKDFKFPKEDSLFTITIPDSWEPEFDDEGTLEGEDKDGNAYIAVWEEDTETELSKVAEDLNDMLKEYAKDIKLVGKPEQYTLSGMPGLIFVGTAKDKDDDSEIGFEAIVLVPKKDNAAVIYYDYAKDAPESVAKRLVKILESVKPVKGE